MSNTEKALREHDYLEDLVNEVQQENEELKETLRESGAKYREQKSMVVELEACLTELLHRVELDFPFQAIGTSRVALACLDAKRLLEKKEKEPLSTRLDALM